MVASAMPGTGLLRSFGLIPDLPRATIADEELGGAATVEGALFLAAPMRSGAATAARAGSRVAALGTSLFQRGAARAEESFTVRRFLSSAELKQLRREGLAYDPMKGSGIPTTTRNFTPATQDIARARTGARSADRYVDLDVTGVPRRPTTSTRSGLPEYPIQGNITPEMIIGHGRVPR